MNNKKHSDNSLNYFVIVSIMALVLLTVYLIILMFLESACEILFGESKMILPIFIISIIIYCIIKYKKHNKPITFEQAEKIANQRSKAKVKNIHAFKKTSMSIDNDFKSSLKPEGKWYQINIKASLFPAYVSSLLRGKRHEWVVLGIEKDGNVCEMWINKGDDNKNVSVLCGTDDLIDKCKKNDADTIIRIHNHPNNVLRASLQDIISAKEWSDFANNNCYNWFDLVCGKGTFKSFYIRISDKCKTGGCRVENVLGENDITPQLNYKLYREWKGESYFYIANITAIIIIALFILMESLSVNDVTDNNDSEYVSGQDSVEDNLIKNTKWIEADLDDFDYKYQDGGIVLNEYKGSDTSIVIPSSYSIENTELLVIGLNDTFRNNSTIENIIISDGVADISTDTFYGCSNLKHLYIPESVSFLGYGIKYIENGEILYFEGTEERWNEIKMVSWSDICFDRVVYDATVDDCYYNKVGNGEEIDNETDDCVPLSDFRYDLKDGGIILNDYIGNETVINIGQTYFVNEKNYPVVELYNTFALENVNTVIVPEGVATLSKATFNSCGINKLYLPSSLKNVEQEFWGYFYNLDTLYYGGTEEEFKELLYPIDRWDVNIKHIIYEADSKQVFEGL